MAEELKFGKGKVADFTLKIKDQKTGEVLVDSKEEDPEYPYLSSLYEMPMTLPDSVWRHLDGKGKGQTATVAVSAKEAFGEYDESRTMEIPLDELPDGMEITPNEPYQFLDDNDEVVEVVFKRVDDEKKVAVADMNHPFAGKDVNFEIEIVEVRNPNAEDKKEIKELLDIMMDDGVIDKAKADEIRGQIKK